MIVTYFYSVTDMIIVSITTPASIIAITGYVTFISMVKVNIIVHSIVTVSVTVSDTLPLPM